MDSHSFVGDFGMGLPSDNRYLNQFNLGGGVGSGSGMDINAAGLDFSSGMMMIDPTGMLGGGPTGTNGAAAAGMIDFPDELNSPTSAATSGASLSGSLSTASVASADAIPFPASLATEPLSAIPMDPMLAAMPNGAPRNQQPHNSMGMDMGMSMGMGVNMNPTMTGAMGMNAGAGSYVPDANQMYMPNFPMAPPGMMLTPQQQAQLYYQQQQQQQYMRMMHQQRQYAVMQRQNAMLQQQQQQQQQMQMQQQQQQQQQNQPVTTQQMQVPTSQSSQVQANRQQQQQQVPMPMPMQQQPTAGNSTGGGAARTAPPQQTQQARGTKATPAAMPAPTPVQRQYSGTAAVTGTNTSSAPTAAPSSNSTSATTTNGSRPTWHSSADQALRKEMLNHIMRVLRSQGSNAPPNWLQKLPEMAHRLEDECYRIAATRDEYANTSTLQNRLKNIVRAAQNHQRVSRAAAPHASSGSSSATSSTATTSTAATTPATTVSVPQAPVVTATPIPFPGAQAVASPSVLPTSGANGAAATQPSTLAAQAIQMPPELQDSTKRLDVQPTTSSSTSSSIIDALMSEKVSMPESSISPLAQTAPLPLSDASNSNGTSNIAANATAAANSAAALAAANRSRSAQIIRQFKAKALQVTSALDETQTTEYHNKLQSMTSSDIRTAGSKEVLQRQQQRLLLLRHAMWCKAADGACTATPSCGEMKRLWQHMGACHDTNSCSYSHCISSKYVLSHFQQCTNALCLVCQVVRFPVEVKEKNGQLMLDAERALQQIYAVTQRRRGQTTPQPSPANANASLHQSPLTGQPPTSSSSSLPPPSPQVQVQAQPKQAQQSMSVSQPMPIPMPPQLQSPQQPAPSAIAQQTPLPLPLPPGLAMSPLAGQSIASSPANGYSTPLAGPTAVAPPAIARPAPAASVGPSNSGIASSGQQQSGARMANAPTPASLTASTGPGTAGAGANGLRDGANASDAFVASLTEDDRRQLTIIQQKLLGWSVEQLNGHCKKLESLAEQIRTQMNAYMNECRHLLQQSNTTQDVAVKGKLERRVNEKRATLKSLDVKYKRCNTQRRIVKHIITTRAPAAGPVPNAPMPPTTNAMPQQQLPPSAMHPIAMPPQIQATPVPYAQQQPMAMPMAMAVAMPQQQQPMPMPMAMPPHLQQQSTPVPATRSVVKQSPDDILGEEMPMPIGMELSGVAGKPLDMPPDLQEPSTSNSSSSSSVVPAAAPPVVKLEPQQLPSSRTGPAPRSSSNSTDDAVNPLTMNNSKLNAMMKEHRRMDSAAAAAAAVKTEASTRTTRDGSPSSVEKLDLAPGALVPATIAVGDMVGVASGAPTAGTPTVPTVPSAPAAADAPTSMLNELSNDDLEAHIDSLVKYYNATMPPAQLKKRLEGLLKGMMEHKFGWVFSSPVDPVVLGIPNYFKIIRRPMDLGTIKKKLDLGIYKNVHQFAVDVRLTFTNAKTYNSEEQDVYNLASDMLADFNAEVRKLEAEVDAEERAVREKESACRLCGVERMVFEPAVLYCNGECNSRIRRNCYYYTSSDNKYHCCHPCLANLGDTIKHNEGRVYRKSELTRKKNDEVHEEPWVQCDCCNRWVHQICALFNGKIDAEKKPQHVKIDGSSGPSAKNSPPSGSGLGPGPGTGSGAGPNSVVTTPSASSTTPSSTSSAATTTTASTSSPGSSSTGSSIVSAHAISSTPGSEFQCPECLLAARKQEPAKYKIGRHAFNAKDLMRTKLSDYLERRIAKALEDEREDEAKWTHRPVADVVTAESLTVRVVSNIEKQLMVRDKMFQRYKESHKYTYEHRFKSKCICMFQEIHGVSVLLFGMYVHEFDEQEAACNARRVYISYLDSVNYFEPPHLRTKVYHELLIAYLDFVKALGFHTAHLWACPPLKGDDYILYCHPESQKTPKSDRLRQWYVDMLVKAQAEGVVWQITNMYDDYWRDDNPGCALPYFEGDYWVGLAEDLIEKIEAEKPKKPKKTAATKRKPPAETVTPATMKKGSKKSKAKKTTKRRKTGPGTTSSTSTTDQVDVSGSSAMSDGEGGGDGDNDDTGEHDAAGDDSTGAGTTSDKVKTDVPITSLEAVDRTITDPLMVKLGEVIEPMKDDFLVVKLHPSCRVCNTTVLTGVTWQDRSTKTEVCLNPKIVQTVLCDACYQRAKLTPKLATRLNGLTRTDMAIPLKIVDPDEVKDSEFFDTRQAFLSLCQGNHYQFDELRRAKHSSMMALYHLGNPNPNAYIYECNACTKDIVTGNRWHCHTCPDFDVCDACYEKEKHEHALEMIPTSGAGSGSMGANGASGANGHGHGAALTDEQRRLREHRAKNVRLHMQLLVHSSSCADGNCGSSNCEKMKELMRHGAQCKLRAYGGCTICRRVWALLQLHARQCRQYECKVPRCHDLREHVRKLQLQQQLMDDRRRAAVTQQYRQMQSGSTGSGNGSNGGDDGHASAEDESMGP